MIFQSVYKVRVSLRLGIAMMLLALIWSGALAQEGYKKAPPEVESILSAPVTPTAFVSPARDSVLLATGLRYPPIADLAEPMLRLAGQRINPNTNAPHRFQYFVALSLKRLADRSDTNISLPAGAKIGAPIWSADGKRFLFTNTTAGGVELWVGEGSDGRIKKLKDVRLNTIGGDSVQWMPDNKTLLVQLVPAKRSVAPAPSSVPREPNWQESSGRPGPVRTFQDLLRTPYDEYLFEYYATAQLALVDAATGKATTLGSPGIFRALDVAPDAQHVLVGRIHRPFSYLYPDFAFPRDVEIWDTKGKVIYKVASLPLADQIPTDGVPTGPRNYRWVPTEPATLVWVEALDGGDPKKKVPHRDRVLLLKSPFNAAPVEVFKTEQRFAGMQFGEKNGLQLISDYDRDRRWIRTFMLSSSEPPKVIWSRSSQDRYGDPGTPVTRLLHGDTRAIIQDGDWILLNGAGASPEGDRPFLNRFNLKTLKSEEIFRSDTKSYESVVAVLSDDGKQFITRRESATESPNYQLINAVTSPVSVKALTNFPNPTPQLNGITKQLVTYKRADGVQCSFTLYLPAGYKAGTRLPTVVWAYPLEFTDSGTAGQVSGSTQRFTQLIGPTHLFFLLQGYAVLDNATMPVVGDPETVNNTYIEQIVMSAKAAIDKAAEMGVTDPARVGVGGHSYGAFMTANLLAHSDLFRAGIARSGAYNRTLTPFGFQSERRTIWEAPDLYMKVSPFMVAHKINEPILFIHGEADDNQGTFPIQSERMYQAVRGNGGTVRLVTLPLEAHGYASRETIEHVLYEMITWFDRYVKNAPPRPKPLTAVN